MDTWNAVAGSTSVMADGCRYVDNQADRSSPADFSACLLLPASFRASLIAVCLQGKLRGTPRLACTTVEGTAQEPVACMEDMVDMELMDPRRTHPCPMEGWCLRFHSLLLTCLLLLLTFLLPLLPRPRCVKLLSCCLFPEVSFQQQHVQVVLTEGFSASATVPAIKSTASLSNYATVAAFNTTERARVTHSLYQLMQCCNHVLPSLTFCAVLQFVTTLEANILKLLDVLANVTIDSVTQGSVNVDDTISFTGADSASATSARDALFTALTSGDTSIFGTSFGSVKVSGVTSTNSSNTGTLLWLHKIAICCHQQFVQLMFMFVCVVQLTRVELVAWDGPSQPW